MPELNPYAAVPQILLGRAAKVFTLHARAAESAAGASGASGSGTECYPGGYRDGVLIIDADSVPAGAALTLALEMFDTVSGTWVAMPGVAVPQITAPGRLALAVSPLYGDNVRLSWTPAGGAVSFAAALHAKS